jgi:hypothetical protein
MTNEYIITQEQQTLELKISDCYHCHGMGEIYPRDPDELAYDCPECFGTGSNYDDLWQMGIELGCVIPPEEGGVTEHNIKHLANMVFGKLKVA